VFVLDSGVVVSSADTRTHWDRAYRRDPAELSWYQPEPVVSLELIDELAVAPEHGVVDVGGGTSSLAGRLLERGFRDVTVLDVSPVALAAARARLGARGAEVTWLERDVRSWRPERRFDLWHDRAVLHFLVDPGDRRRYLDTLAAALAPGGAVIVATFALDGPERCSGLPVVRYDGSALGELLGPAFELVVERREEAMTPSGTMQPFTWAAFRHTP